MTFYNTRTRQLEPFTPGADGVFRMYACGPTVYNLIHIGNARPLCVFDALRRFLMWRGFSVKFVQNFTDVDDKIIQKAQAEGVSSEEIAERFIAEFQTDAKGLGLLPPDVAPRATESIPEILEMIAILIEKGHAYQSNGDVYFSTESFPEYGKLSRQPLEQLSVGARVAAGELKRDPLDFALWKAAKPDEPQWETPWGAGRPGWHIECSAMARRHLGEEIDVHCGGQDLIFPHHENEIAQSECVTGKPFARYWMHNGYINVDHVKMSKSLGNFFTVREVAEKYGYPTIRYLMLASHYRSPMNYSREGVEAAASALQRLSICRENLRFMIKQAEPEPELTTEEQKIWTALRRYRASFIEALENDFNTAEAIGCLFALIKDINILVLDSAGSAALSTRALELLEELCAVLGLSIPEQNDATADTETKAQTLVAARQTARAEKNFALADALRQKLQELGYGIEDTSQGPKLVHLK